MASNPCDSFLQEEGPRGLKVEEGLAARSAALLVMLLGCDAGLTGTCSNRPATRNLIVRARPDCERGPPD